MTCSTRVVCLVTNRCIKRRDVEGHFWSSFEWQDQQALAHDAPDAALALPVRQGCALLCLGRGWQALQVID